MHSVIDIRQVLVEKLNHDRYNYFTKLLQRITGKMRESSSLMQGDLSDSPRIYFIRNSKARNDLDLHICHH